MEERNPVTQLNNIHRDCVYELTTEEGASNNIRFHYKLTIDGKSFHGTGPSKKEAKAHAARQALKHPAVNPNYAQFRYQLNQDRRQQSYNVDNKPQQSNGKKNVVNYKSQQVPDPFYQKIKDDSLFMHMNGRQVCRLFLDGMCVRGRKCPYYHPEYFPKPTPALASHSQSGFTPLIKQAPHEDTYKWLQFCQNYTQLCCPLSNCRFLHISSEEEKQYHATGRIPSHITDQAIRKALLDDHSPASVTQPCKAYLNGQCTWYTCPFRHITRQEFAVEVRELLHEQFRRRKELSDEYRILGPKVPNRDLYVSSPHMPLGKSHPQSLPERHPQPISERYSHLVAERNPQPMPEMYSQPMPERYPETIRKAYPQPMLERYPHRMVERSPQPMFERQQQFRQDNYQQSGYDELRGEDYLLSGMSNLMRNSDFDGNQREINKLREELGILNEENEKLKFRMLSLEEDKRRSMHGLETLKMLNEENERLKSQMFSLEEDKRRIMHRYNALPGLETLKQHGINQYKPPELQHVGMSNKLDDSNHYGNLMQRYQVMGENNAAYNFDQVLNSLQRKGHKQQQYQKSSMPFTTKGSAFQNPQRKSGSEQRRQQKIDKQKPTLKLPVKKSGQVIKPAVMSGSSKKYSPSQNKTSEQQQKQNQRQQQKPNKRNPNNKSRPNKQNKKKEEKFAKGANEDKSVEKAVDSENDKEKEEVPATPASIETKLSNKSSDDVAEKESYQGYEQDHVTSENIKEKVLSDSKSEGEKIEHENKEPDDKYDKRLEDVKNNEEKQELSAIPANIKPKMNNKSSGDVPEKESYQGSEQCATTSDNEEATSDNEGEVQSDIASEGEKEELPHEKKEKTDNDAVANETKNGISVPEAEKESFMSESWADAVDSS